MAEHTILVFGHTRPASLQYVLEGLKRQGALANTQVWLDGDQGFRQLKWQVHACRSLERRYPVARWVNYGSRCGFIKLFIDATLENCAKYKNLIILQDDCFPGPGAVDMLLDGLRRTKGEASVFSVYGHHFGTPDEGEATTAFECWGWAVPSQRLEPLVREMDGIWRLPEYRAVEFFRKNMTRAIRQRMDVFPGRTKSGLLENRFCFDAALAFLIAREGLVNRKTPEHAIFNFGIGRNAGHFARTGRRFLARYVRPPFNMTLQSDLIERFDLGGLPNDEELIAETKYAANPTFKNRVVLRFERARGWLRAAWTRRRGAPRGWVALRRGYEAPAAPSPTSPPPG